MQYFKDPLIPLLSHETRVYDINVLVQSVGLFQCCVITL